MTVHTVLLIGTFLWAVSASIAHAVEHAEAKHQRTQAERWKTIAARQAAARIAADEALEHALLDRPDATVLPLRGGAS